MSINNIINFVCFQIIWLAAVFGAAHQILWPCLLLTGIFALWQLHPKHRHPNDIRVVLCAIFLGVVSDSIWQISGMIDYASSSPSGPFAPLWIMALWISFALTFNHSLAWITKTPWQAALFGLLGAPLSYWAGSRFGALDYLLNGWISSVILGLSWAFIVWFLSVQSNKLT